ncbi:MAG: metallophosphoesterase [Deltaproteobacteria bacterium]|nr:metallophosphoesterase [Deltaproteobacteria bacterium]
MDTQQLPFSIYYMLPRKFSRTSSVAKRILSPRFRYFRPLLLVMAFPASLSATEIAVNRPFSFVVVGHVRGNSDGSLNPILDTLLAKIHKQKPDMIFLTGDMIWGGLGSAHQRPEIITQDWERLDGALARLDVPVYRVPGNHDLHDPITRDIYFARYGKLPQAFTYNGTRFLLLNSTFVPAGIDAPPRRQGSGGQQPYLRGKQLDPGQIDFIRKELSGEPRYDNVFLFMHHVLWWHQEEAVWWSETHPLLVGRKVRGVFAGDVGPRKFSHVNRDGIDYIQSSIADIPMENLRLHWRHRMIAQQFDNYLRVKVDGQQVMFEVETIGELSSGQFTPQSWRKMHKSGPPEVKPLLTRVWDLIGSPRRLAALLSVIVICFLIGVAVTLIWNRRKVV